MVPDEKLEKDANSLLGLGPAKMSKVVGKLIKLAEEDPQELEGQDTELYRKATGKLIYQSSDRRDLKYVAKVGQAYAEAEEGRHGVAEVSWGYVAGRGCVEIIVGAGSRRGAPEVYADSEWQGCLETQKGTSGRMC